MAALVVPARYNGPPGSGNGGWSAGSLAGLLAPDCGTPVTVRLRQPPPLDTELVVDLGDGTATASSADRSGPVLEAVIASQAEQSGQHPVPRVSDADARAATAGYRGATDHPFPTCFSCGPARPAGDGLHLAPGPLPDRPADTACTWTPTSDVDPAVVWAALDCPGGWSVDLAGRPVVLGTITAVVHRLPAAGEECVVMGRALDQEGRKARTSTTLWSGDEVLAQAGAIWLAVDPGSFPT